MVRARLCALRSEPARILGGAAVTWAEDALVSLVRFGSLLEHGRRWSVYVCELGRLWTFDDDGTGGALALVVNPAAVTVEPPCGCGNGWSCEVCR